MRQATTRRTGVRPSSDRTRPNIGSKSTVTITVVALSLACTVKEKLPVAVGVPEIVPEAASDNPLGSEPDDRDHVYGARPPSATKPTE